MRILLLIDDMHPKSGGPPRVVSGMAAALAARGDRVEILALCHPSDNNDVISSWPELTKLGVPMRLFPFTGPAVMGRSRTLTAYVRQNVGEFDLLHVHCVWHQVLAGASGIFRRASRPYVVSAHGELGRQQMRKSAVKKFVARKLFGVDEMLSKASSVIFATDSESDEIGSSLPITRRDIIPNGVTVPLRDSNNQLNAAKIRSRFPQSERWNRTFLFFGRLYPTKGLDLLIEAFASVSRDFRGAGLVAAAISQDLELESLLHTRISELGTDSIVLTTDFVGSSAQAMFDIADVFVLPSHHEGFSMATLEAAASGLPVLITDKCHMPEFGTFGAGLVVADTASGLEAGLRDFLRLSDADIERMGKAAATVVAEYYSWDRVADLLSKLYRSLSGHQ